MSDDHFPWSYTSYGVLCVCGQPMTSGEECPDDLDGLNATQEHP